MEATTTVFLSDVENSLTVKDPGTDYSSNLDMRKELADIQGGDMNSSDPVADIMVDDQGTQHDFSEFGGDPIAVDQTIKPIAIIGATELKSDAPASFPLPEKAETAYVEVNLPNSKSPEEVIADEKMRKTLLYGGGAIVLLIIVLVLVKMFKKK